MQILKQLKGLNGMSFAVLLIMLFVSGCGSQPPSGNVTGTITWKGQPVTEGVVSLYSSQTGTGGNALIQSDGTFHIKNVRLGSYEVQIAAPEKEPESPQTKKDSFPIPIKQRTNNGFTCTVQKGDNQLVLDFK